MNLFRFLPSVDALLGALSAAAPALGLPRPYLADLAAAFLDEQRSAIRNGLISDPETLRLEALLPALRARAEEAARPHFRPAVNASGVVLHTNMGRAPLADEAVEAVIAIAGRYSNLELDLATGERGSRYSHVEELLRRLTGAEAALVVNNNAAAILLVLDTLCKGREVPVSRGQLVEVGGSFRIPEVMEKSGAILREVGTTNRTWIKDYENALNEQTGALLRVHTSNYRIIGFTADVSLAELARLAKSRNLPLIEDLGSGSFHDFTPQGLPGEPVVAASLRDGADVITFSGDKLLGGPQAGVICGKAAWIARIKSNPLNRALRVDKMTLAALEATLRIYLDPARAAQRIPALRMITASPEELAVKARRLSQRLRRALGAQARISLTPGSSAVGGGSFPEHMLPTTLVSLIPAACSVENLRQRLLSTTPPIIARVERDALHLDPRTIADDEFSAVASALTQALE